MTSRWIWSLVFAALLSFGACGGDGDDPGAADAAAAGDPDAADSERTRLLETPWTLDAGTEVYWCTRWTAPETMYITEFYPVIPLGTHHTVVTLDDGSVDDGSRECSNPFEGGARQIYGTGVGSVPTILEDGIAIKVNAGEQIVLNLHLFNIADTELEGVSAIEVVTVDESEVEHEATSELFGKVFGLTVAPGESVQSASCTIVSDLSLVLVQPHMHQYGSHLKGTITRQGGGEEVLYDRPYDFDEQAHEMKTPVIALNAGDQLTVDCTYNNTTGGTLGFGESSDDEMCFLGLLVYPSDRTLCNGF
jgi:hypothetical protein